MDQPDSERQELAGQISTASTATNECHQAETAVNDTAQTRVANSHTRHDKRQRKRKRLTLGIGRRQPSTIGECKQCGGEMVIKRKTGPKAKRYCSNRCRQIAWLEANPEKAVEKAEKDKERLKAHILANGGEWEER